MEIISGIVAALICLYVVMYLFLLCLETEGRRAVFQNVALWLGMALIIFLVVYALK